MKKCASCTKDLPDAALHCVFCGAKQAPTPAVSGGGAKTVMGHASNEMLEQLKAQAAAAAKQQAPSNLPAAAPYSAPRPQQAGPSGPQGGYLPPQHQAPPQHAPPPATIVPQAASVAPTMFVPGGGGGPPGGGFQPPAPQGGFPNPGPGPGGGYPSAPAPMVAPAPLPTVIPPVPMAPVVQPYRSVARAGRPVEPWKDTLRLLMFIWGGVLLLAFLTPLSADPMTFSWDMIIDGEGAAKLEPLTIVAVGLLSLVLAWIPMSPSPRGLIAGLLGLAGILIPIGLLLSKISPDTNTIVNLVSVLGLLALIPGLLLRDQYRDSIMPRILVTLGVIAVLLPLLIPRNDSLPLVDMFKAIIDAEGKSKIRAAIGLGYIVIVVLCLLAWLPSPAGAGVKVFAWLLILWPAVEQFAGLLIGGNIGEVVKASPYMALMQWAPQSAFLVLVGYGFASVFGKQLE